MPAIREGRWDCESCGTTGIKGRDLICPGCGARRPENVTFYLPDDEQEVTDEALIERAKAGADWVCEWCGASNPAMREVCKECGAEKGESRSQEVKEYGLEDTPRIGDATVTAAVSSRPEPEPETSGGSSLPIFAAIGVVLLLIAGGLFFLLRPVETTATVTSFSWERTIDVEKYATVTEEGDSVPAGGRVLDEIETHVNEKVDTGQTEEYVCGKKDLGNGMFEDKMCERPVYKNVTRTKITYRYEIEKWVKDRTERASGKNRDPTWPEVRLGSKERESSRNEEYTVHVRAKNNKDYEVNFGTPSQWMTYQEGQKVDLKVNALGHAEIIE